MTAVAREATRRDAGYEIDVEDVTYLTHGSKALLARLYRPRGAGPFPVMIDLHGGAWVNGDRHNDKVICEALARSGVVVAAIDFRMPPDGGYPASLADINFAVRWARAQAKAWNARGDRIGLIGISSGGHQAMLAAMRPSDPRYGAVATADVPVARAAVQCVVLLWPVIDAIGRYRYAKAAVASGKLADYPQQLANVIPSHDKYWGSETAMEEASPPAILERGEPIEMPPVLYVQGDADRMHPRAQLDNFVRLYRAKGGVLELALYEGEVEGFVTRQPKSQANQHAATRRIIEFVHRALG
jgi:acetyl esterase/lipase